VPRRVLILGGTEEGRSLARRLAHEGYDVITSLSGATSAPMPIDGRIRTGNFGGSAGLAQFLNREGIELLLDATHPFAVNISSNALAAARACGIALLRLERPAWRAQDADRWISVKDVGEAARCTPESARVFLTTGHRQFTAFLERPDLSGVIRTIEKPKEQLPAAWTLLLSRPPFSVEGETSLMRDHRIDLLVSKNSGGEQTVAKLIAARLLHIPVLMVERVKKPEALTARSVDEMMQLVQAQF
jgi:precorrin-6A/cobalt-precorrin-6A reductase